MQRSISRCVASRSTVALNKRFDARFDFHFGKLILENEGRIDAGRKGGRANLVPAASECGAGRGPV